MSWLRPVIVLVAQPPSTSAANATKTRAALRFQRMTFLIFGPNVARGFLARPAPGERCQDQFLRKRGTFLRPLALLARRAAETSRPSDQSNNRVPMTSNLLLAAGLACALLSAIMLLPSLAAAGASRTRIGPVYPRALASARARRVDRRYAGGLFAFGAILYALGAYGFSAPIALWRYPAGVVLGVLAMYGIARLSALRPVHRRARRARPRRALFESRRTMTLRVAAEREAAALIAREMAHAPRDRGVVYLRKHWERRWWSDKLGVSTAALEAAIGEVGPMTRDVRRHLARRSAAAA